jgi:hypothetical protein
MWSMCDTILSVEHSISAINIADMYAKYFTLKDYYTSDGANSKEYYDDLQDWNCDMGDGDPESIKDMHNDLQELITGCNNIIREK